MKLNGRRILELIEDIMEAFDKIKPTVNTALSKKYDAFRNQS